MYSLVEGEPSSELTEGYIPMRDTLSLGSAYSILSIFFLKAPIKA